MSSFAQNPRDVTLSHARSARTRTQRTLTRAEAGRRGGRRTLELYGAEHMRTIGQAGAKAFWKLYRMHPAGTAGWVIMRRDTGAVVNFIGSLPFPTNRTGANGAPIAPAVVTPPGSNQYGS